MTVGNRLQAIASRYLSIKRYILAHEHMFIPCACFGVSAEAGG